jgi:alkanesulfonate monooxygenase SsuD/methylene tetrahydromethanopterin reductase-like flavin-dependent oxidoreductase (luciferase family)
MPDAKCISPSKRRRRDIPRDGVCRAARQAGDDVAHYQNVDQTCERALLDVLFLADSPSFTDDDRSPTRALDPVVLITACALATEHLGLVLTASTRFSQPYNLAQSILTLDQVSRGRVGWNIVTTADVVLNLNFGMTEMPSSDLRYEMAADFTAAVRACWKAGTTAPWSATSTPACGPRSTASMP